MASNQYKPFAAGGGANALSNSDYIALTTLIANGFQAGVARSEQVNTVLRQATVVAAMIGEVINDAGGDALDDGSVDNLQLGFMLALAKSFLTNLTNTWNNDAVGGNRLYFETSGGAPTTTYVKGYGTGSAPVLAVQGADNVNKLRVFSDGTVRGAANAADPFDLTTLQQVQALLASAATIGSVGYWPGAAPPTGWIKRNGALVARSSYPLLAALVTAGTVQVVSEGDWPNNPGAFTLGDGSTTIRIPDGRGLVDKGYHDGSGSFTTNTTRALGSYEADGNQAHFHQIASQAGTNGGANIAQTDRAGNTFSASTTTVGNPEATVRNAAYLPIIRAY